MGILALVIKIISFSFEIKRNRVKAVRYKNTKNQNEATYNLKPSLYNLCNGFCWLVSVISVGEMTRKLGDNITNTNVEIIGYFEKNDIN